MRTDDKALIERLLAQNEKLIDALTANQPVEVIRALNPPAPAVKERNPDPWSGDVARIHAVDPWEDPDISNAELLAHLQAAPLGEQVATEEELNT